MERLRGQGAWEKRIGDLGQMAGASAHIVLTLVTLLLLFLPIEPGTMFGSEGDWYSQHVGAAEALRQAMTESGTIFPQFIGIGGGANAYDLAYYGLLRPDVLLSCLLPDVEMRDIIAAYAVIGVVASVNLTFSWLKSKKLSTWISICGGLIMAGASCFFHAHHQIMFVNYMPFLVLALMGVDRVIVKQKSLLLAVSVFLICMHSFYYAPVSLLVCLLYGVTELTQREGRRREKLLTAGRASAAVVLGIGMAAVLLLPTAIEILSNGKDGGSFMEGLQALDLSFSGLLYQAYGCGMTLITLYCLLLSLTGRRKRLLAAALLVILMTPAIWLLLSGFLYPRAKILIPLVPLLVWICADTLEEIYQGKVKASLLTAALCAAPLLFTENPQWHYLLGLDLLLLILWAVVQRYKGLRIKGKNTAMALILIVPLCTGFGVSKYGEDFLKADDNRQSRFSFGDITMFADDSRYRFDYLANNYINSNVLPDGGICKTASYLSITNSTYADFYYNTAGNPISLRNRVVLMPNLNQLFNYFMGIKYVLIEEDRLPDGYKRVFSRNGFVLAENQEVLPICYGGDAPVSEEELGRLNFPEKMAALCGVGIEERNPAKVLGDEFPKSYEETDSGKKTLQLKENLQGKILIITFEIDRKDGRETCVAINGMKNNLSGANAPYPNKNDQFKFVLTAPEELEILCTKGNYEMKNLKVYAAEMPKRGDIAVPVESEDFWGNGRGVFAGSIEMDRDGYFITSYPWKQGYQVTVDGKQVEPEKVNTAFLGFPLKKGSHEIEICFQAPGFEAGAMISLGSLAALALLAAMEYMRERKREQ